MLEKTAPDPSIVRTRSPVISPVKEIGTDTTGVEKREHRNDRLPSSNQSKSPTAKPGARRPRGRYTVNDGAAESRDNGVDGPARVGGVKGFFTCDGGCDKETVTEAYGKAIIAAGGKYHAYDSPLLATLANGETKPIISGFLRTDVEVRTTAGKVISTNWHVDVIRGPCKDHLLYLGQREERELNLKSYKQ